MKDSLETRLGMFVALVLIAAIVVLEMAGGLERFKGGTRVAADFNNVLELNVGDPVKMAGVSIGRVEKLAFAEGRVRVTMKLHKGAVVKTDSQATVKFAGLMGQNFVSLTFGSPAAPLADDRTVLTSVEQADFSSLMSKLDNVATGVENLTKTFTGDKIDNLLGPLMSLINDNKEPLTQSVSNLAQITSQISQGRGTLGRLVTDDTLFFATVAAVTNVQDAVVEARSTLGEARSALAGVRQLTDKIHDGKGTVGLMLTDDTLYREAVGSLTNLHQILQKVNQGEGSVGKLVNDPSLFKNANLTLQKVDKATESLEDQGVLSVLGIALGNLF